MSGDLQGGLLVSALRAEAEERGLPLEIVALGGERMRAAGATLLDAAQASGVQPPFAAAVNLQFVPRSQYNQTLLQTGDQVELISPVTGG